MEGAEGEQGAEDDSVRKTEPSITPDAESTKAAASAAADDGGMPPSDLTIVSREADTGDSVKIIEPPIAPGDNPILLILKELNTVLLETTTHTKLKNMPESKGIRQIQGGRYEIFLEASEKTSDAFDWVAEQIIKKQKVSKWYKSALEIRTGIISYAKSQAERDARTNGRSFKYGNFSLIVSYEKVDAQMKHIDLVKPNHQFALIVTDYSPGTIIYKPDQVVQTVQQLKHAMPDLPRSLENDMHKDPQTVDLLCQYGSVLSPNFEEALKPSALRSGTLCSMPGSVVHAGPASNKFRAVIFFSGSPGDSDQAEYDPDTQYFASSLFAHICMGLWLVVNESNRIYLLTKLAEFVQTHNTLHLHLEEGSDLQVFTKQVKQKTRWWDYVVAFSKLEPVSHPHLNLVHEDCSYPVTVFRHPATNNSVRICYHDYNDKSCKFEGNPCYMIEMDGGKKRKRRIPTKDPEELFDGTNGVLKDDKGRELEFVLVPL